MPSEFDSATSLPVARKHTHHALASTIGPGFEDVAVDFGRDRSYLLVEAMLETDGSCRAFVVEYDDGFKLQRCSRRSTRFEGGNKGFEGHST